MELLFKILFVIAFIAFIFCLCVFAGGIFMTFQKNELPDLEDVKTGSNAWNYKIKNRYARRLNKANPKQG